MEQLKWSELSRKYKGLWVALKRDEKTVVSWGKNAKSVYSQAKKGGVKVPILYRVPSRPVFYVGRSF